MTTRNVERLARLAFEAYNDHAGGKTWDGKPIPTWDELTERNSPVPGHWKAAIERVLGEVSF